MFGFKTKDRKDPADIATEFAKDNDIEIKDENPTPEGSEASADDKTVDSDKIDKKADDKVSQEEDTTQKDGKQEEDKEDQLTEEEQKLVDMKDDELDDDAKVKKQKVVDKREAKRNTKAEKRINDLITKVKELEESQKTDVTDYKQRLDILEAEKKALEERMEAPKSEDSKTILVQLEKDRITQYMSEDSVKPKEQRREMQKDEIDEWLVEDYQEANDWLNRRYDRRKEERIDDENKTKVKGQAETIIRQQKLSQVRVTARHRELMPDVINARKEALKLEGKNAVEIQTILCAEIPKYKAMRDVMSDKAFMENAGISPDGPEMVEKEMLKRLDKKPSGGGELEARIAELEDALKAKELKGEPVGTSVGSRTQGGNKVRNEERHNPLLEAEIAKMKKKGLSYTKEDHEIAVARRRTIPGVDVYEHETD